MAELTPEAQKDAQDAKSVTPVVPAPEVGKDAPSANVASQAAHPAPVTSFKPGSVPAGAPAPSNKDQDVAVSGIPLNPPVPGVQRGRVFTQAELWSVISKVQRVAWLRRAGVIGDPQLDKHSAVDWHKLEPKVMARLGAVR